MKWLPAYLSTLLLFISLLGCTPKESFDQPEIKSGAGFFYYRDQTIAHGSAMRVFYYKPGNFNAERPILFFMHGADRKVDQIPQEASGSLEKYNILLILPEFSERLFPKTEAYQYGNVRTKPKKLWTYYVNDRIFELVKRLTGSRQKKYFIWGNSAGAQFVHRQLLVGAYEFIAKAFASNAGVYTMPTNGLDPYPFSLKGLDLTEEELKQIFSLNFFILLGEDDVFQDKFFLINEAAMRQGINRLERGKQFYAIAKKEAQKLNTGLNWQLITVPGCGHNPNSEMQMKVVSLILDQHN
jgi:hypothetical protein